MDKSPEYDGLAVMSVDMVNDFFDGSLPVSEAEDTIVPMNEALAYSRQRRALGNKTLEIMVREYHPSETVHFEEWPAHGVVGTHGAEFREGLAVEDAILVDKGFDETAHGYSGFEGVTHEDRIPLTELINDFSENVALVVGGLATDYCIKNTVIDARARSLDTYVLEDAIRAVNINPDDGVKARKQMEAAGAIFITTQDLVEGKVIQLR